MSLPRWRDDWTRHAGVVGVIVAALCLVVLAVFVYLVPLARGEDPARRAGAPAGPAVAAPAAVLPSPVADGAPEPYADARYGFEVTVPAGWRRASVEDGERPALAADYDLVWEDPESRARASISVWDARQVTSFPLWSALVGAGLQSVDGQMPTNAVVAGRPALLAWAAETPTTPARYALFLARDDAYYRVAYAAHDGGAAVADFARMLATLHWPGEPAATLLLPLRGLPASRYWPSDALYGR